MKTKQHNTKKSMVIVSLLFLALIGLQSFALPMGMIAFSGNETSGTSGSFEYAGSGSSCYCGENEQLNFGLISPEMGVSNNLVKDETRLFNSTQERKKIASFLNLPPVYNPINAIIERNTFPDRNQIEGYPEIGNPCIGPPIAYDVWGTAEICEAEIFSFGLVNTEPGVQYTIYTKCDEEFFFYDAFIGDGQPYQNSGQSGDYWFQGINECGTTWMNGHAYAINFDTQVYITASENPVNSGTQVSFTAYPRHADNETYLYYWIVNGEYFPGDSHFTYFPENGDLVTVEMYYPCFDDLHNFNNTILMMVLDSQNHSTTWTGNSNNTWQNSLNWSSGVPSSNSVVNIPGNLENYPTLQQPASCESIIIENGGSFIGSEFLNYKSALVERNVPDTDFHFLSSPLCSIFPTFGSVYPTNQNDIWARKYNEHTGDWINLRVDDYLFPGTGYSLKLTQSLTASFIGYLNSNSTVTHINSSNPGNDLNRVGWNLLGNPFPCAIDWDLIPNTSAEQAVYLWDGIQYISWNGSVGALVNGIIPPQNGFFVKALDNPSCSEFTIPLTARVHSNVPFYKDNIAYLLELQVAGNNLNDVTFIHFNDKATSGFNPEFDARKLFGIEKAPQLFSFANGMEFSINELPFFGSEVIELGFKCGESGNFILNGKGLESFNNKVRILLEDQKEGILQDLLTDNQYIFSYIAGESEHRFKLHFTEISSNPESAEVKIYSNAKTVIVNNFTGLNGEIRIYDFSGRMILNSSIDSGNQSSFTLNTAAGPYVVKVITAKGVHSRKVVIL